jgi:hypothetical protein
MQWIVIGTPPFTDIATFDALCAATAGSLTGWRPGGSAASATSCA